ncbi:hypothetical protein R1flu_024206 [Riccia fluitans]|uniref:Phenolic acid decarboxylase n=1 Tax=Riccia fluitans TaxID=41844 RepID=A0ABD1XU84_9MARC
MVHQETTPKPVSQSHDITKITGKRLLYTYENGWLYEVYVKNSTTIDYRIYSGPVAKRWVKNQKVNIQLFAGNLFKISWCEPTGTAVTLCINLDARQHHGVIYFPRWVHLNASKTALFQNHHLLEMRRLRDSGPTYPIDVVNEFAELILVDDVGVDKEDVISMSPTEFAPTVERLCKKAKLPHILAHFGEKWGSRDPINLVGKHLGFTYRNGWQHELYVRTASSIDYRIRSRLGSTWHSSDDQDASISRLIGPNRYIVSWTDVSSGISTSLTLDVDRLELHGVHFLPQWILTNIEELQLSLSSTAESGHRIVSSSPNSSENSVTDSRDAGNTYPLHHVVESTSFSLVEDCEG